MATGDFIAEDWGECPRQALAELLQPRSATGTISTGRAGYVPSAKATCPGGGVPSILLPAISVTSYSEGIIY